MLKKKNRGTSKIFHERPFLQDLGFSWVCLDFQGVTGPSNYYRNSPIYYVCGK